MKTIWILLRDLTETGGGERVCINLANAWCSVYKVHIWSFHHGNADTIAPLDSRVEVTYLSKGFQHAGNPLRKVWNKSLLRLALSLKMRRLIRRRPPEILFCNDGTFIPPLSMPTRCIRLWHLRCPEKGRRRFRRYHTMVVLTSDQLARWKSYHHDVRVIPNFLPVFPEERPDDGGRIVLSVGRMERSDEKGFLRLLAAWECMQLRNPHPEWRLRIVGGGVYKNRIEEEVRRRSLTSTVVVSDFTPQIENEYRSAGIYAMCSYREGFSMALLESASWGVPAVAYDIHSGPSDIIAEGESGYLVPDGAAEQFAGRLSLLMDDDALRHSMGKAARERARCLFSQERVLAQWLQLFDEAFF